MKGIVLSCGVIVVTMSFFVVTIWYSDIEHHRSVIQNALKRSMVHATSHAINEDERSLTTVIDNFEQRFKPLLPAGLSYQWTVVAFQADPLLLRIQLTVKKKEGLVYRFDLEETVIEK